MKIIFLIPVIIGIALGSVLYLFQKEENYHYAAPISEYYWNFSFQNLEKKKDCAVKGAVVNHHLLAPHYVAQVFKELETKKPITVVVLSPNHFNLGHGSVISSSWPWKTKAGILKTDEDILKELKGLINIDPDPFSQEHGISNLVNFLKKEMPQAKFVPLIIRDNISQEEIDKLAEFLNRRDLFVVASLDFSHYLTSDQAQEKDEQTLEVINSLDYAKVDSLNQPDNVDSKAVLKVFLKYLNLKDARRFILLNHSNSALLTNQENLKETTSYITGIFCQN